MSSVIYCASTSPMGGSDGGTVFATQGGGYWIRIFSGPISVRWFGAWGDGFSGTSGAVPPPPGAYQVSPQTTTLSLVGLSSPGAVCAGGDGNLYVADSTSNKVFQIPRNYGVYKPGALSTVGTVTALTAIAADGSGNVYVADNSAVYRFSLSGTVYTRTLVAGSFSLIVGVGVDRTGNIYVADSVAKAVYRVPFTGGTTYGSAVSIGTFASLTAMTTDSFGTSYVLDSGSKAMYWLPPPALGGVPQPSGPIQLPAKCVSPTSIAVDDSSNIYVLDLDPSGKHIYRVPSTEFSAPQPSEAIPLPATWTSPTG